MSDLSLTTRNATLGDLATLLQEQHARKLDVVAPAGAVHAESGRLVIAGTEPVIDADGVSQGDGVYVPTEVCDEGIAAKLGIPLAYLRRMRGERVDLYDGNVNGWLHGAGDRLVDSDRGLKYVPSEADPRSFLVRCFRGDDGGPGIARAFLSDRYGIVDNLDVLTAALAGVREAGVKVDIDGCDLTERRMYVRVVAPQVKAYAPDLLAGYRSPFDARDVGGGWTPERVAAASQAEGRAIQPGWEPVLFAGFVISNSETGGGAFTLTPRLVVQVCANGLTITADALRAIHLGARQEDGVIQWSDKTQRRALELVTARAADAVATFLDVTYVRKQVEMLTERAGTPVVDAAKTVETVAKRLQYTDGERATILDHFVRGGQLTAGGILQAVTSAAQTVGDADRAFELEASAVRALDLAVLAGAR